MLAKMISLSFLINIALIFSAALCGECDMTDIVSFQDCVYFCVNKYGEEASTQRKFYNRYTGMC